MAMKATEDVRYSAVEAPPLTDESASLQVESSRERQNLAGEAANSDVELELAAQSIKRSMSIGGGGLIRFIDFRRLRLRKSFPRYPQNKNLCISPNSIDFSKAFVVFISHCWLRGHDKCPGWDGRPHPDNAENGKFSLMIEGLEKTWSAFAPDMKECYVWLDFGCIDQDATACDELKYLDKIIGMSDVMLTIVVDKEWELWDYEHTVDGYLTGYKAPAWSNYLSRAWCRVEMLYAANVYLSLEQRERSKRFRAGLRNALEAGRRGHLLYGTKESKLIYHPGMLNPLKDSYLQTHSPLLGNLSQENDRETIKTLLDKLMQYTQPMETGYTGGYNESGQRHGLGKLVLSNGFCYEGSWKDDLPDGEGRIQWPNGNVYIGEVEMGHITGSGEARFAGGNVQTGKWVNGKMHGMGGFRYVTGGVYDGMIKDGLISGWGNAYVGDGHNLYSGEWNDGIPELSCASSWYLCSCCIGACKHCCCRKLVKGCFLCCNPMAYTPDLSGYEWDVIIANTTDILCCGIFGSSKQRDGGGFKVFPLPDIVNEVN